MTIPEAREILAGRLVRNLRRRVCLRGYPSFYLYPLSGESRYSLVASEGRHKGAVFGYVEGDALTLYGLWAFRRFGGSAWGKYRYHTHHAIRWPERVPLDVRMALRGGEK